MHALGASVQRALCDNNAKTDDQLGDGSLMRAEPQEKLNPRIKAVWRISDALMLTAAWLILVSPGAIALLVDASEAYWAEPYVLACTVLYAVLLIVFLFAVTPLRYIRWHYELRPDFLELKYGIIWRKHIVVPFIRVQNTDTKQGPILRAFGLASVTVSTAAGSMEIPGLLTAQADDVRDRAAEFARLAREDV